MANIWDEYERDLFSEKKKKDEKPASSNIWDDLEQEHFNPKPQAGLTSSQISSSIDRYQAGLYGVGEAVAEGVGAKDSAEWLKAQREENERLADKASQRARDLGAVDQWKDVHGVGDFGSYAKGLAIQSLPYAAEAITGGIAARGAMSGTRAALAGAKTLEEAAAAKKALDLGSQAGAVAASYPSAVGDVLGNQREQSGETRGGVAAALAVPYAALNAVGIESALARGTAFKNTVNILDRGTGLTGAAARTAATATGVALKEGASETGQEMLNQVGRMSVDANEDFLSAAAQERFKESFIGGAALGGMAGAVGGGWRRSEGGNELSQAIGTKAAIQPDVTTTQFIPPVAPATTAPVVSEQQVPPSAPAVSGGTTDIAAAQQQAQAAQQQQQMQEQKQAAREEFTQRFGGVRPALDENGQPTQSVVFQNKTYHTRDELNAAVDKFVAKDQTKDDHTRQVQAAFTKTYSTQEKTPNVNSVVSQTSRYTNGTTSVEEAAGRVNTEIATMVSQGKKLDDTKLSKLAEFYENLTGAVAPAYVAAEQAQPTGVKDDKLQLQNDAGLREVPVSGGTTEASTGGDGGVRPTQVQPVGATSVGAGPSDVQAGQPSAGGVRPSAGNVPNVGGGEATPQVSEAANVQAAVSSANQVTGERLADENLGAVPAIQQEQSVEEQRVEEVPNLIRSALRMIYKSDRKVDLLLRLTEKGQRGDYAALAKEYDVTEQYVKELASDAITDEGQAFPRFIVANIDKFMAAVNFQAEKSGISVLEALDALSEIHDAYEGGLASQLGTEVNEGDLINAGMEVQNVKERTDKEGKGTGKIDRTNVTDLAEEGKTMEALMQQYVELADQLEAATEANDDRVEDLEKQVAELTKKIAETEKKEKSRVREMAGKQAPKETDNAVQVESADEGDVREPASSGKTVGKGNAKREKPAGKAKQAEVKAAPQKEEVKTEAEQAADAWDAVATTLPGAPTFAELSEDERNTFIEFGPENWSADDVRTELVKLNAKFGSDARAKNPYTVAELSKELKAFTRTNLSSGKLVIVESVADLLMSTDKVLQKLGASMALNNTFGVAVNGKAYLIANRIEKGRGRAKFMHEVGAHLGLENLLPEAMYNRLTQQIVDWAKSDEDTIESVLATRAAERVMNANTPKEDQRAEMLAYFVEEAVQMGIDPTATQKYSAVREWMRTLMAAFKEALRKLGFNPETLTARDVVDMAFGAAQLELTEGKATGPSKPKFGFAGVKATGAATEERQTGLVAAQLDLANGEDPKAIWEKTGWYKGTDGQWRFEFDDTNAQFKGFLEGKKFSDIARMEETTLGEILDHEELFQNYPELRDVKFEVRGIPMDFQRATQGWFDVKQNKLFVTPYAINPLSTVLHEVQHWIQSKEGFENGANPSGSDLSNKTALRKLRAELVAHIDRAAELEADRAAAIKEGRYRSTFDEALRGFKAQDLLPAVDTLLAQSAELAPKYAKLRELDAEIERVENAKKILAQKQKEQNKKASMVRKVIDYAGQMQDLRVYANKAQAATKEREAINAEIATVVNSIAGGKAVAHEIYRLVAGEAEARNTQSRQNMSAAERRASFPESTMDVRPENTLRSTGRGGAYMSTTGPRFGTEMSIRLNEGLDNVLPASVAKPAKSVVTNLATAAKNGLLAAGITEDIVNMAGKYMRSAQGYLTAQYARQKTRLDFEQRIEYILDAFDKLPKALQGEGAGSVNRFILDSTMAKKWGFYPGEHRIGTTLFEVDPDLAKRFAAFPADAQQVIRDVFEHGYQALKAKKEAIDAAVEREFAERTKAADGDADLMAEVAQAKKLMRTQLSKIQNVDFTTPYAYLGRYGDYVVAAKSAEFKYWEGVAAEKGENKERAAAWLADNVSNPDHYVVQFAETQGEADQIAADLMATGKFDMDGSEAGPKEDIGSFIGSDVHLAVARLRNLIARQEGESGEGNTELDRMVSDLYLMTAAENSARKSEIMRKYVSGANANMMRNLATSGRADAHFLSTMKHNDEVVDSLERMRTEAKRNVREAMPLYNELYKRQTASLEYKTPSTLSQALTQATSVWFLSTSPAFYLQQLLQTTVLSLPYMSGRLGYFRSVRAIKAAYGDVASMVKGLTINEHIDFSKAPADVRAMLQTLVGMGKIDIGIDADAKARAGEHNVLNTVMRKLQGVNNRIEAVNRATAAIAAYRGYIQRYGASNTDAATKFAAEVVSNTHGSYDGFNTPRILNSDAGRLVGQFKRFQIIQLSMLGKLINTAFKGAGPEERVVARRALAFITGHMAVVGGALGVPFVQQVASLMLAAFGDDDEPKDLEYKLRQAIGDETMANLLLNGVPAAAGVNLGGKLGMGNVASILPFTDVDLSTRSGYEKVVVGLMGPFFGGLAPKMIDGAGMIAKGEYYKGLELLMPNGIGNAMKGARFASEGVTMRNGDVVLKPEEISMADAAFQAVGLPTTTITGRQYAQKVTMEFDKFYTERAASIKGAYVNANRDGDTEGMAEARKDWEELQASRKRNGYKIQPMSELFKATVAARKREAGVVEGVETSKSNKEFVKNII